MVYDESTDKERYYSNSSPTLQEYAKDVRFSDSQLEIVRYGIENGIDVSVYANPEIPTSVMWEIFTHLKNTNNRYVIRTKDSNGSIVFNYITCRTKTDALNAFITTHGESSIIDIREHSEV